MMMLRATLNKVARDLLGSTRNFIYTVVGGVPAKIIKYRYDEPTIGWLLKIKWWNRPIDWLRANSELLCDMEKMKSVVE